MGRHKVKATIHKWDDEWLNIAVKVMAAGLSADRVAKAINNVHKTQLTRNSVIGRINRMRAAGDERFNNLPDAEKINGKPLTFLFQAWQNGIPSNEIADHYGIHRNTVGKKAAEYGFNPREQNHYIRSKDPDKKKDKNGLNYKPFKAKNEFPNPEALGLELVDLKRNSCKFVIGDGPFYFCGVPLKPGSSSSYCPKCHRVIYVPSQPKVKEARRV